MFILQNKTKGEKPNIDPQCLQGRIFSTLLYVIYYGEVRFIVEKRYELIMYYYNVK